MNFTPKEIANRMGGEVRGDSALVPGPGHSRADRSLSIKPDPAARNGYVLHSFAGDDFAKCRDHVDSHLGIAQESRLATSYEPRGRIVATYAYHNEHGQLLYEVVRFDPKDFRQRRPDGRGGWIWKLDDTRRVPYRLPALIKAVASHRIVVIVEGEKDVDALRALGLDATTCPGGAGKWRPEYTQYFRGADVVIIPDNDNPGQVHARAVAAALAGVAARIRVLDLVSHWPECPEKGDISDWIAAGGTRQQLDEWLSSTLKGAGDQSGFVGFVGSESGHFEWPDPEPLPDGLPPVDQFASEFLPNRLAPWVDDIANRLQCPPDYVAVSAMVALGSLIGRRIGVKPQVKTDWIEVPNVWGAFIGRPGMLKSPAMNEALKPIHHLEAEAAKEYEVEAKAYAAGLDAYQLRKQVKASLIKDELKKRKDAESDIDLNLGEEPKEPLAIRYRTNDTSYESLGELLINNPTGILIERDELISLLMHLDRDDQAVARGFYLSGWSGTQPYTFDRIGRGQRHINAVCLSVLGNTQPSRIGEYVRRANAGGAGGDGLIQRFGLMVWPDAAPGWKDIDEYPDSRARSDAWEVFERLAKLDEGLAIRLGAQRGPYDKMLSLRLDHPAHDDFLGWRTDLEHQLRSGDISPALEGHLAKYRKLVPALALMNHLADEGQGPVSSTAMLKALALAKYLESHARRVYGAASEVEGKTAKAILAKIRAGDLTDGFTARDIQRHEWANLSDREHVQAGLNLLVDLDHLAASNPTTGERGGRPKVRYSINPKVVA
jgi:putative DNA primase/helicase